MPSFDITKKKLSDFAELEFEPCGKWFEQYNYLKHHSDHNYEQEAEASEDSFEDEMEIVEPPSFVKYLESLDPKEWKEHDHYKILGLETLRFEATPQQIKRAHKQKVLKHHPDKKEDPVVREKAQNYFTCITRAMDILSDPVKRMSFDSCDPKFNDDVPPQSETSKKNFFKVFGAAIARNARWSKNKNVPLLGSPEATFDEVNDFYNFWYDLDSWREYSYLDEENKETATDRDERRWIEKENRAKRLKKKKEEVSRIRKLVDNAYACDPRIARLKAESIAKRDFEKNKKKEAARIKDEQERQELIAARKERERLEEEEKANAEQNKANKEKHKKNLKKERKNLRIVIKEHNYFASDDKEVLEHMERTEALIEQMSLLALQTLNAQITKCEDQTMQGLKKVVFRAVHRFENKDEDKENEDSGPSAPAGKSTAAAEEATGGGSGGGASAEEKRQQSEQAAAAVAAKQPPSKKDDNDDGWSDEEVKLLVKALKTVPNGTMNRWEVVANFIEEHSRGKFKRTNKEVLAKNKAMQRQDAEIRAKANLTAYETTMSTLKANPDAAVKDKLSERFGGAGEQLLAEQGSNPAVWSTEEQAILEQALKTYGATEADRWEKIAECLPARSKKDCMVRYKELVELVQSKKKAAAKAK